MGKIITANFKPGETSVRVTGLTQYDYGAVLRIQGLNLPPAVEIHFSLRETGGEAPSCIGTTKDGVTDVVIPDGMLENSDTTRDYHIYAWIYLRDETSGETVKKIIMRVNSRSKPTDYTAPDPERDSIFREAITAVNESAERAETAEKSAEGWTHGHPDYPERDEDNAAYYAGVSGENAGSAYDSMVKTQRLAEQVHIDTGTTAQNTTLAERYKTHAAQSAENALLSEQAAKSSETATQEARADAENAERKTELFAGQAAADKASVELIKSEADKTAKKITEDKNTVQGLVDGFTITHQQAVADVNNAGQTQTERVENAGETAVDNIETSRQQAVKSVSNEGESQKNAVKSEGETQVQNVQAAAEEITGKVAQIEQNTQGISELKGDLDTLNQGGLNLKEDFIAQQVNEWLDGHPEATTTVQDGSIEEIKINKNFLPWIKKDYVTPEMFGAVGDGVTDDTEALQSAFDSGAKVVILLAKHNYKVSKQLNITNSLTLTSNGRMTCVYALWNPHLEFPTIITDNSFEGDNVLYITAPNVYLSHFGVCNIYQTKENQYVPTYNGIQTYKQHCHAENLAIRGYKYGFITNECYISIFQKLFISACIVNFFDRYTVDSIFENLYLNTNSFMSNFIKPNIDFGNEKLVGFLSYGGHTLSGSKIEWNYYGVLNKSQIFNINDIIFDWNNIGVCIYDDGNDNNYLCTTINNCFFMSKKYHIKSTARRGRLNVNGCRFHKSNGSAQIKEVGENLSPSEAFRFYPDLDHGDECCFYNCDLYNCAVDSIFSYTPYTKVRIICCNKGKSLQNGVVTNLEEISCF